MTMTVGWLPNLALNTTSHIRVKIASVCVKYSCEPCCLEYLDAVLCHCERQPQFNLNLCFASSSSYNAVLLQDLVDRSWLPSEVGGAWSDGGTLCEMALPYHHQQGGEPSPLAAGEAASELLNRQYVPP